MGLHMMRVVLYMAISKLKEETKMRERVAAILKENYPEIDFESSNELVDEGVLDSLMLVGIISALSMEFGVMFPYEDIVPENFNSIDSMTVLVEKYC